MEFLVDIDDWLGGYPYESVLPEELEAFVNEMGFRTAERFNVTPGRGVFGTGCGEWRFENRT
jgi:2-polyprenyl-6-hydroxyphenyl methylase/3-demethylubiquinone-9 3-methyltransferase